MDFTHELTFTKTYRQHLHDHPAIREAHCLRAQFPGLFDPILPGDRFAGRIHYRLVGFGLELASGGPGYFCHTDQIQPHLGGLSPTDALAVEEMLAFWKSETTIEGKLYPLLSAEVMQATSNPIAGMGGRLSGTVLNFDLLAQLGMPGLRRKVQEAQTAWEDSHSTANPLVTAMVMALDLLAEIMLRYAEQARSLAQSAEDEFSEREYLTIAGILEKLTVEKPASFREAIQLHWLFALISGTVNYGRMDVAMGDFLSADLDSGRLTGEEALALLQALWRMMADRQIVYNSRVFIGGMGRRNVENADRFALLAMEATRTVLEVEPQLTLRIYTGMDPALMEKALTVIGEGRTFPMLFNDDVNVPAVMNGFGVELEDAVRYLPYGCGEYALEGISFGSPNCGFNLLKALEATLHQGCDAMTGEKIGLDLGRVEDFQTFEDLWQAYCTQVEFHLEKLADRHRIEYQAEAESAAFLFPSLLYADCIERGRSLVDGGVRFRGGVVETFSIVNTGDSLRTIQKLVFEDRRLTLKELVTILDANYDGFENQRRMILSVPKYGNDDAAADRMVQAVSDHCSRYSFHQAERIGFDYFLIVNINNWMNVSCGRETAASADGRRKGEPVANGNTPTAGNDTCGVTAFLNSIVKLDPSYHAGYTHNMKFSRSMFQESRPKLKALMDAYFSNGGTQAMITVVNRGDLEAALLEPQKYRNLMVRVGGFSARFVDLEPAVQADLIHRTLHE